MTRGSYRWDRALGRIVHDWEPEYRPARPRREHLDDFVKREQGFVSHQFHPNEFDRSDPHCPALNEHGEPVFGSAREAREWAKRRSDARPGERVRWGDEA